jgi:hypothetical protein
MERQLEGGLAVPSPILSRVYHLLSEGLVAFDGCRCAAPGAAAECRPRVACTCAAACTVTTPTPRACLSPSQEAGGHALPLPLEPVHAGAAHLPHLHRAAALRGAYISAGLQVHQRVGVSV